MEKLGFAAIGAVIGFVSSLTVLLLKETFDRGRQRRVAINMLVLMISSLRRGIDLHPERVPHVHLDKMMPVLHDLAARDDLTKAYANYDQALREYRDAWANNVGPTAIARDKIDQYLIVAEAVLEKYKNGTIIRLLLG